MQRYPPKPMTPFDENVTNQQLQLMKLLLPYFPIHFRRAFAFYIKFTELQNTLKYFSNINASFKTTSQPFDILEEIRPYLNEHDLGSIDSIVSIINMMEIMKTMNDDFMPDLSSFTDISDIFNTMNNVPSENDSDINRKKGNDENECK